jgi:hypothetical protein
MDYFSTAPPPPRVKIPVIILSTCAFVVLVVMIANIFVDSQRSLGGDLNTIANAVNTSKTIMVFTILFVIAPILVMLIYGVHCILNGGCQIFVLIITINVVLLTVQYLASFIVSAVQKHRAAKIAQEKTA